MAMHKDKCISCKCLISCVKTQKEKHPLKHYLSFPKSYQKCQKYKNLESNSKLKKKLPIHSNLAIVI